MPIKMFYGPKDLAVIFDMSLRQVYFHAHRGSQGFPRPKLIGTGRKKTMRFAIDETMQCAKCIEREDEE